MFMRFYSGLRDTIDEELEERLQFLFTTIFKKKFEQTLLFFKSFVLFISDDPVMISTGYADEHFFRGALEIKL